MIALGGACIFSRFVIKRLIDFAGVESQCVPEVVGWVTAMGERTPMLGKTLYLKQSIIALCVKTIQFRVSSEVVQ